MYEIVRHVHGEGVKQAMAKRKLDNLGYTPWRVRHSK